MKDSAARRVKNSEPTGDTIGYAPGRGFLGALMALCALLVTAGGLLVWYVPSYGLGNIHPLLPALFGAVVLAASLFILTGTAVMAFSAVTGRDAVSPSRFRWVLVKVVMPLSVMAGGLIGLPRIKIEKAFIDINNRMVLDMVRRRGRVRPERILILMPHCIQYDDCKIKVTRNVRNCVGCGKCEIGALIGLSTRYGVDLFVATGGTVARKKVKENRPSVVVAVACERDLTSGIQDAYPLPVLAIINERPNGYCMETGVSITEVSRAVEALVG
ncbi:MAG TPA: DUF116 domain-containing protein [Deltaproteobacteria bacterium]|nr:DUF116 domain-containing protein [Deltaproteobacteria bacterium]